MPQGPVFIVSTIYVGLLMTSQLGQAHLRKIDTNANVNLAQNFGTVRKIVSQWRCPILMSFTMNKILSCTTSTLDKFVTHGKAVSCFIIPHTEIVFTRFHLTCDIEQQWTTHTLKELELLQINFQLALCHH